MTSIDERVTKALALELAQVHIDKAVAEARLGVLLDHVRAVLQTTQWVENDNRVSTPVVAAEPFQALQALVLNPG